MEQPDAVFDFDGEDVERPGLGFDDPRARGVAEAARRRRAGRRKTRGGAAARIVLRGEVNRRQRADARFDRRAVVLETQAEEVPVDAVAAAAVMMMMMLEIFPASSCVGEAIGQSNVSPVNTTLKGKRG